MRLGFINWHWNSLRALLLWGAKLFLCTMAVSSLWDGVNLRSVQDSWPRASIRCVTEVLRQIMWFFIRSHSFGTSDRSYKMQLFKFAIFFFETHSHLFRPFPNVYVPILVCNIQFANWNRSSKITNHMIRRKISVTVAVSSLFRVLQSVQAWEPHSWEWKRKGFGLSISVDVNTTSIWKISRLDINICPWFAFRYTYYVNLHIRKTPNR